MTASSRPFSGRRRLLWACPAIVATTVVMAAACSSNGHTASAQPQSTTAVGAAQPSGSPLNVMTIASVNYSGPTYANILNTATVAGDWINAHGGINGHPLHVTTCDEQGDPSKTAQCGRPAISSQE